jgi:hypothetical protein
MRTDVNSSISFLFPIHISKISSQLIAWLATCFHAGILLSVFDPEDRGVMFLQNTGWLSTNYMVLYPKKLYSSNIARL